jgi:CheY-like chemotaxis protein
VQGDSNILVGKAIAATNRGAELVKQLLSFSANQVIRPEILEINQHLRATADMLRRVLDATIEVSINEAREAWYCKVDPGQLETALLNLAINAKDAMPRGGKLTMDVGRMERSKQLGDQPPGSYLTLTVTDTGVGMSADVLSHVFEPFFTTKEQGKGTGLGLSMVYGFVRRSQGHITLDSRLGRGTTVTILLPQWENPNTLSQDTQQPQTNDAITETILLVEDDGNLLEMASQLLQSLGYQVLEACDGQAAIEHMANRPKIDLLLTDVVLPKGLNGPAIAAHAMGIYPDIKVLYMSGYNEHPDFAAGQPGQGPSLIAKPFRKVQLASRVRAALGYHD